MTDHRRDNLRIETLLDERHRPYVRLRFADDQALTLGTDDALALALQLLDAATMASVESGVARNLVEQGAAPDLVQGMLDVLAKGRDRSYDDPVVAGGDPVAAPQGGPLAPGGDGAGTPA